MRATVSAEACVGSIDVSEVMVGIVVAMAQLDDGELQKEKKNELAAVGFEKK